MSLREDIGFLLNRRDAWRFSVLVAILLVGALLELAAIASIPLFISLLLQQGEIPSGDANRVFCEFINGFFKDCTAGQRLFAAGAIILIVNLIRTVWNIMGMALQYRMQANRRIELSGRLLRGYLFAKQSFHDSRNSSELLNNLILECDNVIQGTVSPILEFVRGGALIVSVTVLLFIWTPAITAAALGLLGISCAAVLCIRNRRLKRLAKAEQLGREESMKTGQEALDSRIEAEIYGRRSFFDGRFSRAMEGLSAAQGGNMLQIRATWPLLEFLSLTALMLVAAMAWILANGDLAKVAPQLALLAMALVRLRSTSVNLMQSALEFRRFRPSLAKVCQDLRELEDVSSEDIARSDAVQPMDFRSEISVQNLTYTYSGATAPALDNVSINIAAGTKNAIIGATGCGKSTLLKTLLGIVEPQNGRILIDGKPLGECIVPWRHAIGYVPQKPFMMDATLAENISMGTKIPQDDKSLRQALDISQLSTLLAELPDGLNTRTGEHAQRLSGGQSQRLALARALFRGAKVLVFDEATSALDQATENAFAQSLEHLPAGTTTIVVTHRLANLESYDRIFFMQNGRIEAFGTYAELKKNSQKFNDFAAGIK